MCPCFMVREIWVCMCSARRRGYLASCLRSAATVHRVTQAVLSAMARNGFYDPHSSRKDTKAQKAQVLLKVTWLITNSTGAPFHV